jgi:hypothetical protein
MTRAEWERARQLGEEARRAGKCISTNPFAHGWTDEYIQKAVAWDEGYHKEAELRERR